jgi:uncharacterized membrane protein (Fun14 family)
LFLLKRWAFYKKTYKWIDNCLNCDIGMDATILALQAVGGFTVGSLLGYALRKVSKWLFLAMGIFLIPVYGLWYLGILNVNWDALNELVGKFLQWLGVNIYEMTSTIASAGILGVSGIVGLIFGLSGGLLRGNVFNIENKKFVRRKKYEK